MKSEGGNLVQILGGGVATSCSGSIGGVLNITLLVVAILTVTGAASGGSAGGLMIASNAFGLATAGASVVTLLGAKQMDAKNAIAHAISVIISLAMIVLGSLGAAGILAPKAIGWIAIGSTVLGCCYGYSQTAMRLQNND